MKTYRKILSLTLAATVCLSLAACGEKTPQAPEEPPAPPVHEHTYETTVVAPTRTEQGYTLHACTVENCTESYKTDYTGVTGEEMKKDRKYNFLFVGNSYTYYNTLWRVFEDLCEAEGFDVDVDAVYEGGWTLEQYADPNDTFGTRFREKLQENTYDYVFLQGQSGGLVTDPETFYPAARTLIETIRASGAEPVLYATWARKQGSVWYDPNYASHFDSTYEKMFCDVTAGYDYIGQELSVPVSHVGTAFHHACAAEPALELYDPDASHPSAAGTYLAVLCHFATVFGRSPIGIQFTPAMYYVPNVYVPAMQKAAYDAVYGPSILPEEYKLEAPDAPTALAFKNRTFSFAPVEGAESYHVTIERDGKAVADQIIEEPSVPIDSFEASLQGAYTIKVTARRNVFFSEPASLTIDVKPVDGNLLIEAEDGVLDRERCIKNNSKVHGGSYAASINSCGQGLYFRYFALEAGERDVSIFYATATANSYLDAYVNYEGEAAGSPTRLIFPTVTGWFSSSMTTPAELKTKLTFSEGWNEIYLIRPSDGTTVPKNGGNVELDYLVIRGTGKEYDPETTDMSASSYRIEAEISHFYYTDNKLPQHTVGASLDFNLGNFDKAGAGVIFRFKVAESGNYKLQLCAGGPSNGTHPDVNVSINGGEATKRSVTPGVGFNVFVLDGGFEAELTAGDWIEIDFSWANSWLTLDYLLVTKL